jgi:hypothetical protein
VPIFIVLVVAAGILALLALFIDPSKVKLVAAAVLLLCIALLTGKL